MKRQHWFYALITALGLVISVGAQAGAVGEMSNMIIGLNHYPSDAEKARLQEIASDANASAQEKTIATALMNMQHSVSDDDKAKLKQIADDAAAPANIREVAGILMTISHKPSADDKAKLQKLAAQ